MDFGLFLQIGISELILTLKPFPGTPIFFERYPATCFDHMYFRTFLDADTIVDIIFRKSYLSLKLVVLGQKLDCAWFTISYFEMPRITLTLSISDQGLHQIGKLQICNCTTLVHRCGAHRALYGQPKTAAFRRS